MEDLFMYYFGFFHCNAAGIYADNLAGLYITRQCGYSEMRDHIVYETDMMF